ncbi:MAG: hypothetical protein Q7T18_03270 [Sedimentisphaerales bacterium]|nr:hypothetical protein [Sedimentisphaerales bacterium]
MKDLDHVKFLSADEQTQRAMIAEVTTIRPHFHYYSKFKNDESVWSCDYCGELVSLETKRIKDKLAECKGNIPVTEDFRILAFELRGKVDYKEYNEHLKAICHRNQHYTEEATPLEMIAAALMAWPEREAE